MAISWYFNQYCLKIINCFSKRCFLNTLMIWGSDWRSKVFEIKLTSSDIFICPNSVKISLMNSKQHSSKLTQCSEIKSSFDNCPRSSDMMVVSRLLPPDHDIDYDILSFNQMSRLGFSSSFLDFSTFYCFTFSKGFSSSLIP